MPVEVVVPVVRALKIKQVSVRESVRSLHSTLYTLECQNYNYVQNNLQPSNYFLSKKAATADHFWLLEAEPANLPSVLFAF